MASPILFAGQEDISFTPINSGFVTTPTVNGWFATTTAGYFRAGYARYSLQQRSGNTPQGWLRNASAFSASSFWTTGRVYAPSPTGNNTSTTILPMRWIDAGGIVRLRLRFNGGGNTPASPFVVEKVTAAGVVTQLGGVSTDVFTSAPSPPDKIDVFINYAVAGQITVYRNLNQIFTFSGDVTTDGQTTLSFTDWGSLMFSNSGFPNDSGWSECIVATRDTRNMSLLTQAASALGATDTFTGGAAANINGNLAKDNSPDFSTTAGQVQQYTVIPAPPAGNFGIISVVQHGRVTIGASGPTHIDFNVRTGAADFFSSDLAPTSAWSLLTNNWDINPNTSAPWLTTDLSAAGFNFGYRSVT